MGQADYLLLEILLQGRVPPLGEDLHEIGNRRVHCVFKLQGASTPEPLCIGRFDHGLIQILHGGAEVRIIIRVRVRNQGDRVELWNPRSPAR